MAKLSISEINVTGVLKQIPKYFRKKVNLAHTSRWDVLILRSFVAARNQGRLKHLHTELDAIEVRKRLLQINISILGMGYDFL
jgi:hypothetical protein